MLSVTFVKKMMYKLLIIVRQSDGLRLAGTQAGFRHSKATQFKAKAVGFGGLAVK